MTAAPLQKTFALDPEVLGAGSALTVGLDGTTDTAIAETIVKDEPLPSAPKGVIELGKVCVNTGANQPVLFKGGDGLTVGLQFSAGVTAGAAIYDDPACAIRALGLDETPGLDLSIGATPDSRYVLLRSGYKASATVSGSHPIGVLGSATFGASAAATGITAVLHRFPATTGARTALGDTVWSWKLPRHAVDASKLKPHTWVIAEACGSLALKLGSKLGYNFNFVRETKAFGLSGDIGLKVDAAVAATFGFDVSGRYVVVIGRESDDARLRLRMFKLKTNGLQCGLNLKVGVTGVTPLPSKCDSFVAAVFGVHGKQVTQLLAELDKWTDPKKNVGELVAGLVNDKALELLQDVTGVDPKAEFNVARTKLLDAISFYQKLPDKVASELTDLIGDDKAAGLLRASLKQLADLDARKQKQAILDECGKGGPMGSMLQAMADHGLLNLLDRLDDVRGVAGVLSSILDGGIIAKLQKYVDSKLNINRLLAVAQKTDFDQLVSFLVGRLAAFFEKDLRFEDLEEVKTAIHAVVGVRQQMYTKMRSALQSRYALEASAAWQRTTADTAIIDIVVDTSVPEGRVVLESVLAGGLDELLVNPPPCVQVNSAVLSHEFTRKTTLDVSLPRFNFQKQSVTTALAKVQAEDDQGRILVYDASGSTTDTVRNKYSSSLCVTLASVAASPDLRVHAGGGTWAYRLLYVKPRMKREEFQELSGPFIRQYLGSQFANATTLDNWYNMLECTSEEALHNGPATFGDTCASFEVTIPGDALTSWIAPIPDIKDASRRVSLAIQTALKQLLPTFYFCDPHKYRDLAPAAPLLTWSAIPPSTGNDVYWNWPDADLRRAMATSAQTAQNLQARLADIRRRLTEAGLDQQFYSEAGPILAGATTQIGDILLTSLLRFEAIIVEKAAEALKDVQKFVAAANTSPTEAVKRLADFAADITEAFGKLTGDNVYADLKTFRAVAEVVFLEATRALTGVSVQPGAMMTLYILRNQPCGFQLADFLKGEVPGNDAIAVPQCISSL